MPLFFSFRSETVTDDEALELFKNFDKNGDGFIPHDELKEVLKDVDVNLTDQVQYIYKYSKITVCRGAKNLLC